MEENYTLFVWWELSAKKEVTYDGEERRDNCNSSVHEKDSHSGLGQWSEHTIMNMGNQEFIIEIRIYNDVGNAKEVNVFKGNLQDQCKSY